MHCVHQRVADVAGAPRALLHLKHILVPMITWPEFVGIAFVGKLFTGIFVKLFGWYVIELVGKWTDRMLQRLML